MVRHSGRNRIVDSLHTGVCTVCGKRVNKLGIGAFETGTCFAAAANEFPYNNLCCNPLLSFGISEII